MPRDIRHDRHRLLRWLSIRLVIAGVLGLATSLLLPFVYLRVSPRTPGMTSVVQTGRSMLMLTRHHGWMYDDVYVRAYSLELRAFNSAEARAAAEALSERFPKSVPRHAHDIPYWVPPFEDLPPSVVNLAVEGIGWPMRCMIGTQDPTVSSTTARAPANVGLIWTGLLADSAVFTAVWMALITLASVRPLRRLLRERRGRCLSCGYDLLYNFGAGCPECGWNRAPAETVPP